MSDWSITITDNQGGTWTPAIFAPEGSVYPKEIPAANGTPTLQFGVLPLSGGDSWFDAKFENADISVSKNGNDQPYSILRGPSSSSAEGIVVLEAEGGEQLERRVETSVGITETHTAASDIVTNNTSYNTDIPTPSTSTTTAALVRDRSSGVLSADLKPQKDTSPAHVDGSGDLTLHQTLHFHEPTTTLSTIDDSIEFSFTTNYSIPVGELAVGIVGDSTAAHVGIEASVDGTVIAEYDPLDLLVLPFGFNKTWVNKTASNVRLAPGTHTARFEVTATTNDGNTLADVTPDGVCVYDDRFSYTFDADLIKGPELYPSTPDNTHVALQPGLTTQAVTGVIFDGTYQDSEPPEITVGTNDQTQTGSGDQDADFANRGAAARVEVGFQSYGVDGTKTPEEGFKVTTIQDYQLKADLETMPMVVDEDYEGTVAEVLTELAETLRGDFIWTFDTDNTGTQIVRFVRTGARSNTNDKIERFSLDKDVGETLEEVKVVGGVVEQNGEQIRAKHNTAVALQQDNVIEGSESVERDGRVYERGTHYTIDYDAGTVTAIPSPARTNPIPDNSLVTVSYAFRPQAVRTLSGVSTPDRTVVVDELPLTSDAAAELAADQILDAAQSPTYVAEAQIRGDTTFSVVDELVASRLPVSNLEVVDISATPAGAQVRLEARQAPPDVIDDVRDDLTAISRYLR